MVFYLTFFSIILSIYSQGLEQGRINLVSVTELYYKVADWEKQQNYENNSASWQGDNNVKFAIGVSDYAGLLNLFNVWINDVKYISSTLSITDICRARIFLNSLS